MSLFLLFVLVALVLFALFWGGGLVAQGYLYQQPADLLPFRAAGAAVLVAAFLTLWVGIDRKNPEKYGTFFEFSGDKRTEFNEFEAVRWERVPPERDAGGQPKKEVVFKKNDRGETAEVVTKVRRNPGGKGAAFVEGPGNTPFQLSPTSDKTLAQYLTAAVVVPIDGQPVRFNALWFKNEKTGKEEVGTYPQAEGRRRFVDDHGRYIVADELVKSGGVVYSSSTGVVMTALLLNAMLFVVWLAALWPVLRFSLWHAVGMAAAFGLVSMLVVMPLLFKPHRSKPEPAPAAVRSAPVPVPVSA